MDFICTFWKTLILRSSVSLCSKKQPEWLDQSLKKTNHSFPTVLLVSLSAAAAMLLQVCPTLWDPIDSSPPGSSVPGILQASYLSESRCIYLIKGIGSFSWKNSWIKCTNMFCAHVQDTRKKTCLCLIYADCFLGPTDLSMKRQLATSSGSSSSSSSRPQLSPTEINAVRQLVAGYRESAAFLLRSADELENLILQQNWVQQRSFTLRSKFAVSTIMTFWFPSRDASGLNCTVLREILPLCHIVLDP